MRFSKPEKKQEKVKKMSKVFEITFKRGTGLANDQYTRGILDASKNHNINYQNIDINFPLSHLGYHHI